jgi:hypothetical protein
MFCNLAPQPLHVSETLSSLAFASKVSSVVLKTPTRRVEEVNEEDESLHGQLTPSLSARGSTPAAPRSSRQSMTPR